MERPLPASAQRVQDALRQRGVAVEIVLLQERARTAQQAAEAIGCTVAQIVKSLVFVAGEAPLLVETSGANRVDLAKLEALLGRPVRSANADEVRAFTGFAIGGIPPVGHARPIETLIDQDLLAHETVYAAGGVPEAIFPTTPQQLVAMTGGRVADVKAA